MSTRLGVAAALVDGTVVPGDVSVDGDVIDGLGLAPAGRAGLAVPGFVDLQVNGYGGVDLGSADRDGYRTAGLAMAATGVTSYLATLPTQAPERYDDALRTAASVHDHPVGGSRVVGVHLEGPFLSPERRGAHPRRHLRAPDAALLARWQALAPVRLVTLAPELDGGLELVAALAAGGVVVSLGHTDATAEQALAAVEAGATAHTHLWNAHRPLTSRDPGPAAVALTDPRVTPCFIADLAHVAGPSLAVAVAAAADRYVVVTDAAWPAGLPDGTHRSGGIEPAGLELTVSGGAARLADGTLAGSTTPLDAAVRNVVALGRPLPEAVAAVTSRPAALLAGAAATGGGAGVGHPDLGRLRVGGRADVVVLDDRLEPVTTLLAGHPA